MSASDRRVRPLARALLAVCFTFLAGCPATGTLLRPPAVSRSEDTLGPGDEFSVTVYGEADMSQTYRVLPNGNISFPYLGSVPVQGKSAQDVQEDIRRRLQTQRILNDPIVSIRITQVSSRYVNVLGDVQHAGTFPWSQGMTVVTAITLAGGFGPLADQSAVRLTRTGRDGQQRAYTLHVDAITQGREPMAEIAPGDVLFVPQRAF